MATVGGALQKAGGFAINEALRILATKLKNGDVTDEKTRQMIMDDLQIVRESLDVLSQTEFNTAKDQIKMAFRLYKDGKDAKKEFENARANAETAVNVVQRVSEKIEAIKMAAVCAVYECGDDMDRAKTFCLGYVDQLLSLPEVESHIDVKYSTQKGITGTIKGLFSKSDRDDIIDQVFSCNRSLDRYLDGTGMVDWQVTTTQKGVDIHPLTVITENRITKGNTCKCETQAMEDLQDMTSAIPHSTMTWIFWERDKGGHKKPHTGNQFAVAGDRGYKVVINAYMRTEWCIGSIQVTNPQSVRRSMDVSDGMKCGGFSAVATRSNLLLFYTGLELYLYDVRTRAQLWKVDCKDIDDHLLEGTCDKHATFVDHGNVVC